MLTCGRRSRFSISADAPSGGAALGDVEVAHDLDARDDALTCAGDCRALRQHPSCGSDACPSRGARGEHRMRLADRLGEIELTKQDRRGSVGRLADLGDAGSSRPRSFQDRGDGLVEAAMREMTEATSSAVAARALHPGQVNIAGRRGRSRGGLAIATAVGHQHRATGTARSVGRLPPPGSTARSAWRTERRRRRHQRSRPRG